MGMKNMKGGEVCSTLGGPEEFKSDRSPNLKLFMYQPTVELCTSSVNLHWTAAVV